MYNNDLAIESFIDYCDEMQIGEYEIAVEMDKNPFKSIFDKFMDFVKWIWEKITGLFKKNRFDLDALYNDSKQKEGEQILVALVPSKDIGASFDNYCKEFVPLTNNTLDECSKYAHSDFDENVEQKMINYANSANKNITNITNNIKKLSGDNRFKDQSNPVNYKSMKTLYKVNEEIYTSAKAVKDLCDKFNDLKSKLKFGETIRKGDKALISLYQNLLSGLMSIMVMINRIINYTRAVNNQNNQN